MLIRSHVKQPAGKVFIHEHVITSIQVREDMVFLSDFSEGQSEFEKPCLPSLGWEESYIQAPICLP